MTSPAEQLTPGQRGATNAALGFAGLIAALGLITLIIDGNTIEENCTSYALGTKEVCVQEAMDTRGLFIVAAGIIIAIAALIARSSMKKSVPDQQMQAHYQLLLQQQQLPPNVHESMSHKPMDTTASYITDGRPQEPAERASNQPPANPPAPQ